LFKYFISGVPPKFPMIWTLFKPSIAIAPFSSLLKPKEPIRYLFPAERLCGWIVEVDPNGRAPLGMTDRKL
jgi:hypothetical protein